MTEAELTYQQIMDKCDNIANGIIELQTENEQLKQRILDLERDGERLRSVLKTAYGRLVPIAYSHSHVLPIQWLDELSAAIASQKPDGGGKGK